MRADTGPGSAQLRRLSAAEIAVLLVGLYAERFGGKSSGKYRISRKFLRQLAGRRRLTAEFLAEIADELFEQGLVLADLETFVAVLDQRHFNSYRRVTAAAVNRTATNPPASTETSIGPSYDPDAVAAGARI